MTTFTSAQKAIIAAHAMVAKVDEPVAIYRRKCKKDEIQAQKFFGDKVCPWTYTVESAWRAMPDRAGELVMIVSKTKLERTYGAWEEEKAFAEAMSQ